MLKGIREFIKPIEPGDVRYIAPRDVKEFGLPQGSFLGVEKDVRTRFANEIRVLIFTPKGEKKEETMAKSRFLRLEKNMRSLRGSGQLEMFRAEEVNRAVRNALAGKPANLKIRNNDSITDLGRLANAADRVYVGMEEEGTAYLQGERVRRLIDGKDDGCDVRLVPSTPYADGEVPVEDRQRYDRMSQKYPAWFASPGLPNALEELYKSARPQGEENTEK